MVSMEPQVQKHGEVVFMGTVPETEAQVFPAPVVNTALPGGAPASFHA